MQTTSTPTPGPIEREHDLGGHRQGALRFSLITGTLTAAKFVDFCQRLLHDAPGPVFLILDGHPVHLAARWSPGSPVR